MKVIRPVEKMNAIRQTTFVPTPTQQHNFKRKKRVPNLNPSFQAIQAVFLSQLSILCLKYENSACAH